MPARHKSLPRSASPKGRSQSESSGNEKRVSARHQVKRLDRPFGSSLFENRSGRRNRFSSFGADPVWLRNFTGANAQVRSGPDVFADALVPAARAVRARRLFFH